MNPVLLMTLIGLGIASTMILATSLLGAGRQEAFTKATLTCAVGAGVNAYMNVSNGAALQGELLAFAVIFGVPAAAAFGLSRLIKKT
jgi:hypothetical protein